MRRESARTQQHWDDASARWNGNGLYWTEAPQVQARLNEKASGDPAIGWEQAILDAYFADRPLDRCLSLGCGEGRLERKLMGLAEIGRFDAYDIAPGAIATAQQSAAGLNIHYTVADINSLQLPVATYDAVWITGALHHFGALETVCGQIAQTLKPNGLFVFNEYVGASQFQFSERQLTVMQAALDLLPQPYRRVAQQRVAIATQKARGSRPSRSLVARAWAKARRGDLMATLKRRQQVQRAAQSGAALTKNKLRRMTVADVVALDPSESIRSAEIMTVVADTFDIVECRPLGGAILQFLLADIVGNFADEAGDKLLQMLFTIEDTLADIDDLPSDFVVVVAKPK